MSSTDFKERIINWARVFGTRYAKSRSSWGLVEKVGKLYGNIEESEYQEQVNIEKVDFLDAYILDEAFSTLKEWEKNFIKAYYTDEKGPRFEVSKMFNRDKKVMLTRAEDSFEAAVHRIEERRSNRENLISRKH